MKSSLEEVSEKNEYVSEKSADNENTRVELPLGEVRISVRNLVEFILRAGDIDNRHQASPENAMQEGGRIHRMIQRRMGAEYQAEVSLKYTLQTEGYRLTVEGRADGIIHHEGQVIIDEIKGTYRELARMREPAPLHIALRITPKVHFCFDVFSEIPTVSVFQHTKPCEHSGERHTQFICHVLNGYFVCAAKNTIAIDADWIPPVIFEKRLSHHKRRHQQYGCQPVHLRFNEVQTLLELL